MVYSQQDWENDVWEWYLDMQSKYPNPSDLKLKLTFSDGVVGYLSGWDAIEFLDESPLTPERIKWFKKAIETYRSHPIKF